MTSKPLRGLLFALLLTLLIQSCSQHYRQWSFEEISNQCSQNNSKRMVLPTDSQFRGMELVITQSRSGRRAYLNIFSLAFPKENDNPHKTKIFLESGITSVEFIVDRLEGGQRLLLSPEALDWIIARLMENESVTISVGRYQSEITPLNFKKCYSNLKGINGSHLTQ